MATLKRILLVLTLVIGIVFGSMGPASATYYGKPTGRHLIAIVSHEVGHCLGWWRHKSATSSSIMRSTFNVSRIKAGYDTYRPTSNDLYEMNRSRVSTHSGETSTYWVQGPFINNSVPVYNRTGNQDAFWAANTWEPGELSIYQVYSEPAHGITILWDSSLAGTSTGAVAHWNSVWNGYFWQNDDCWIGVNPSVVT